MKKILLGLIFGVCILFMGIAIWDAWNVEISSDVHHSYEKVLGVSVDKSQEGKEIIGVGVIIGNSSNIKQSEVFLDFLSANSDYTWEVVPMVDYNSFITQIRSGRIRAGFMGSAVAYRIIESHMIKPVIRGEKDGIADYYGYIFTRKDSGLNTIEQLKDRSFVYVDLYTSAGYLFPRSLINMEGFDPDNFFGLVSFSGGHEDSIGLVFDKKFDGGAAKDSSWRNFKASNPTLEDILQIIARKGPFPERTFLIDSEFEDEVVEQIRDLFTSLESTDEGKMLLEDMGYDRFISTDIRDFDFVEEMVEELNFIW